MKKILLIVSSFLVITAVAQTTKPTNSFVNEKSKIGLDVKVDTTINKFDAKGNKTGLWKEKKEAFEFEGYYANGLKQGMWTSYFPDGVVQSIDNYVFGKLNGPSIQLKQGGMLKVQSRYKNDILDGLYREFNGSRADKEMTYKDGKLNGTKKIFYMNGKVMEEGDFLSNQRNGLTKWFTEEGKISLEYNYIYGSLEGIQKSYYKDGLLNSETTYKNNFMEGQYNEFFEDGKTLKLSGNYSNDKKNGSWKEYDKDGNVVKTEKFKDDLLIK